ncbi:MAG: hypothetical protein WAK82_39590, partial [Streptosporangiaceae bacterium]
MITTNKRIETFIDNDTDRVCDIEHKMLDLERDISEWREARTREFLRVTPRPQQRAEQKAEQRSQQ